MNLELLIVLICPLYDIKNVLNFYLLHISVNLRLRQAKDLRETLVEKLKIATESNLSAEERAARMDELLEDEDKRQKEIDQDLKYLRDLQFKKMQELHELKTKERNNEAEIQVST